MKARLGQSLVCRGLWPSSPRVSIVEIDPVQPLGNQSVRVPGEVLLQGSNLKELTAVCRVNEGETRAEACLPSPILGNWGKSSVPDCLGSILL